MTPAGAGSPAYVATVLTLYLDLPDDAGGVRLAAHDTKTAFQTCRTPAASEDSFPCLFPAGYCRATAAATARRVPRLLAPQTSQALSRLTVGCLFKRPRLLVIANDPCRKLASSVREIGVFLGTLADPGALDLACNMPSTGAVLKHVTNVKSPKQTHAPDCQERGQTEGSSESGS